MGLAICTAAIGLSLPTDGGYWEIQSLDNLSINETTWCMTGGSTVASLVGFAVVLLLSACSGFLPGLH
jgi:GntP family gluconate:H+ symporter